MNKEIAVMALIIALAASTNAFSQEEGQAAPEGQAHGIAALGAGLEVNMNNYKNVAGGAALGLDFTLPRSFAIGLSATASFKTALTAIEAAAMLRRYFGSKGFFVQADAGVLFYMEDEYREQAKPMVSGGLRAGFRLPLGATLYIEPYARGGYPFMFSAGVLFGARFFKKEKSQEIEGAGINR